MTEPPVPINELFARLLGAIQNLADGSEPALEALSRVGQATPGWMRAHLKMRHTTPSPSGILACRYQQWLRAKGFPPDDAPPIAWQRRRSMGILAEPYWLSVFETAGLPVIMPQAELECDVMLAHPDGIMHRFDTTLELKDVTGWDYRRLIEHPPLEASHPEAYAQLQLNSFAADTGWGLYLAAPADPSMLQKLLRGHKRYPNDYELPVFYLEWIRRDDFYVEYLFERARMIAGDLLSNEAPPREYAAITHRPDGVKAWPCGYCLWAPTCVDKYGIGGY